MTKQRRNQGSYRRSHHRFRSDKDTPLSHVSASSGHAENTEKKAENAEMGFVFPPGTLLQEYEYATDGAANRLLDMAREEQQQRWRREEAEESFNKNTIRISQIFGFVAFIFVLVETFFLIQDGKEQAAFLMFFSALGAGLLASLIAGLSSQNSSGHLAKRTACNVENSFVAKKSLSHGRTTQNYDGSRGRNISYQQGESGGYRRGDRSRNRYRRAAQSSVNKY